jgi:hypothetical protein
MSDTEPRHKLDGNSESIEITQHGTEKCII